MSAAVLEAGKNGFVDIERLMANLPSVDEQTIETITQNTILINNQCQNPRLKLIMERLVYHLHQFAKEVDLQTDEWMAGIEFLTATGQKCSQVRQEFILLSDVLGLSTLVDGLSNRKPPGATESTVLGPFHTENAPETERGGSIASQLGGERLIVKGIVKDKHGRGISGARIDVWETDQDGFYDVQRANSDGPSNRGILATDEEGKYQFEAIVPVPYPIPTDGPVAGLIKKLNRHCFRPAHIHFILEAKGYESLTTALYLREDPFIKSDAKFGVKNSLIVDITHHASDQPHPDTCWNLNYDFILPTLEEAKEFQKAT